MAEVKADLKSEDVKAEPEILPVLKFSQAHQTFSKALLSSFVEQKIEKLVETSSQLVTSDKDNKKLILDQCFREFLTQSLFRSESSINLDKARQLVQFSIQAARKEICTPTTPIQILADVFDILPLSSCEILFKTVENEVATWRAPTFYMPIKNGLLRICNDLLRRLSRTQNTVFCGRILLFLAKFFPFSERSGLNVVSEFNLDNVTSFSSEPLVKPQPEKEKPKEDVKNETNGEATENGEKEDDAKDKMETEVKEVEEEEPKKDDAEPESMEIELIVEEKEKLEVEKKEPEEDPRKSREFQLYTKFWKLQDYFRNPTQCYQKDMWETFCAETADIVLVFQKRKLENHASKKDEVPKERDLASSFLDQYFAKYLTNQNLLSLQLNDSNFRRYVLLQFLIIFQYLQTGVKFKTENQVLSTDQTKWIDDHRRKIFQLLDETPPNGKEFKSSVKSILKRELIWIRWKNDGCPSFVIKNEGKEDKKEIKEEADVKETGKAKKRKAALGDLMRQEAKMGKINLGNKGLTKLWNISPDNLEACQHEDRNFLPSLEQFFSDAIEEIDPKNQVEDSYKKVNSGEWGWRALRLMSRRSQHFFLLGNSQISKLPDYLEIMMKKMAADFGRPIGEEVVVVKSENGDTNGASNGAEEEKNPGSEKLNDDQIATLAVKLAEKWKELLPKLGLPQEKVDSCSSEGNNEEICLKLLSAWREAEQEGASADEMRYMTEALKISDLIEGVF